jgi:hypothetical protein
MKIRKVTPQWRVIAARHNKKPSEWKVTLQNFLAVKEDKTNIKRIYKEVFNEKPEGNIHLIEAKLHYFLFRLSMLSEDWDKKAENTKKDFEAAMLMSLNDFSESSKSTLNCLIKGDQAMTKKPSVKKVQATTPVATAPKPTPTVKKPVVIKKAEKATVAPVKKSTRKIVGKTLGLNIQKSWIHCFTRKNWTDEQITKFMQSEFPDRKSRSFEMVAGVRSQYNSGRLTGGTSPSEKSVKFQQK